MSDKEKIKPNKPVKGKQPDKKKQANQWKCHMLYVAVFKKLFCPHWGCLGTGQLIVSGTVFVSLLYFFGK